jgi:CIC family chloride channel protein
MGGLVAGTTRAPITAIITIFELPKETTIILPLMVTCIIATMVSAKFSRESIYTLKLLRRHVNLREHTEVNVMKTLHVKDCLRRDYVVVGLNTDFSEIVTMMVSQDLDYVWVHDRQRGRLIGAISEHTVRQMMFERDTLKYLCIAGDLVDNSIPRVKPDDNCEKAIRAMRETNHDSLPVVTPEDETTQVGVVHLKEIVDSFEREVERIDLTSDLADKIMMMNHHSDVRFLEGYAIAELPAPSDFIGHSIGNLQVRSRYEVDIIGIKRTSPGGHEVKPVPSADYVFLEEDNIVVAGRVEKISKLRYLE